MSTCEFEKEPFFSKGECNREVHANSLCIFHLPKLSEEDKKNLVSGSKEEIMNKTMEETFHKDFQEKRMTCARSKDCFSFDFRGYRFPYVLLGNVFSKPLNLSDAEFMQHTSFCNAIFKNQTHFRGALFHQQANFGGVKFLEETSFIGTVFQQKAYFTCSTISSECRFDGNDAKGCFLGEADFSKLQLVEKGKLIFEKANLGKANFLDTDLTNVVLRDVEWYKSPKEKWYKLLFNPKRVWALWDEYRPLEENEQRNYPKIADNYSQLVINYEKKRDFPTAEQFHIGEMECRRKQKGGVNEYSIYKWLSNYVYSDGIHLTPAPVGQAV